MEQSIINWALAGISGLIGFFLHSVWTAVKDLQSADTKLVAKVAEIEVLVAGNYVKRDEFDRVVQRLFEKLDSISEKIDHKADK
jgi:hypothetical protein